MSRVILCAGKRALKPYVLKTSGVAVYTVEELCYCLRDQLDMLDENVIDRELALFIRDELGFTERGELLEQLVLTRADLKSRLVVIFCTSDYFDEDEIRKICDEVDELAVMSPIGRRKRRADRYMSEGYFKDAAAEYRAIEAMGAEGLSDPEHGSLLHNLGVIDVRMGLYDSAATLFRRAFDYNASQESLKSYFFALKLGHRDSEYLSEAMKMFDNGDMLEDLENEMERLSERAEQSGELDQAERLKMLYQQGRTSEFDRLADEMIEGLKSRYRAAGEK